MTKNIHGSSLLCAWFLLGLNRSVAASADAADPVKIFGLPSDTQKDRVLIRDLDVIGDGGRETVVIYCRAPAGSTWGEQFIKVFRKRTNGRPRILGLQPAGYCSRGEFVVVDQNRHRLIGVSEYGGNSSIMDFFHVVDGRLKRVAMREHGEKSDGGFQIVWGNTIGTATAPRFRDGNKIYVLENRGGGWSRGVQLYTWNGEGFDLAYSEDERTCDKGVALLDREKGHLQRSAPVDGLGYLYDSEVSGSTVSYDAQDLHLFFSRCGSNAYDLQRSSASFSLPTLQLEQTEDTGWFAGPSRAELKTIEPSAYDFSATVDESTVFPASHPDWRGVLGACDFSITGDAVVCRGLDGKAGWSWNSANSHPQIPGSNIRIYLDGDRFYITSQYEVSAVEVESGEVLWRFPLANRFWPPAILRSRSGLVVVPATLPSTGD